MNARELLPDGPIDTIARDFSLGNPDPRHDERVREFARAIADEVIARLPAAVHDVFVERGRQISAEGWTPEHDDEEHDTGELAGAAAAYALAAADKLHPFSQGDGGFDSEPPRMWPWDAEGWKPAEPRRMLVKAGALIQAQIEQIDRAKVKTASKQSGTEESLRAALAELVACKDLKEQSRLAARVSKSNELAAEYERRQPAAWAAARAALEVQPVRALSAQESVAVDDAVGLVLLPPIRVEREVYHAIEQGARAAGLIVQAHVREVLTTAPQRIAALEEEVKVDDRLLADRARLLAAIPGCTTHGNGCVPGAIEWIGAVQKIIKDTSDALNAYHHALDTRKHAGNAAMDVVTALEATLDRPWKQGATLTEGSN